jgi:hypothetical protein
MDFDRYMDVLLDRWVWMTGLSDADITLIETPGATCYTDLYNACVAAKKVELDNSKTKDPFYEPSTFYGSFLEAHYHSDYTLAGSRLASRLSSYFLDYLNIKKPTLRTIWESIKTIDPTEFSEMIYAVNSAGGHAWLFVTVVDPYRIPEYSKYSTAYADILANYSKSEAEFLAEYPAFYSTVNKTYLWRISDWKPMQQKRTFDLSKYTTEQQDMLQKAIECINSMIHYDPWTFLSSDGLTKEYSNKENIDKTSIVDRLFSMLSSKDIFKNAWVITEITSLSKLSH